MPKKHQVNNYDDYIKAVKDGKPTKENTAKLIAKFEKNTKRIHGQQSKETQKEIAELKRQAKVSGAKGGRMTW